MAAVSAVGRRLPKVGSFLAPGCSLTPPVASATRAFADGLNVRADVTPPPSRWLSSVEPAAAFLRGCTGSKMPSKMGLFVPVGCYAPQRRFAATTAMVKPQKQRRQYVTGGAAADLDAADEHALEMHTCVATAPQAPMPDPIVVSEMVQGVSPQHFLGLIQSYGTTFFSGMADALPKDVSAHIVDKVSRESHVEALGPMTALAHAQHHYRNTGKIPCVYLQNFGLGSASSPFQGVDGSKVANTSFLLLVGYDEPKKSIMPLNGLLGDLGGDRKKKMKKIGSRRPRQDEAPAAPTALQGQITPELLKEMGVPYEFLPDYAEGAFEVLDKAYKTMLRTRGPFALLFKKATFRQAAPVFV